MFKTRKGPRVRQASWWRRIVFRRQHEPEAIVHYGVILSGFNFAMLLIFVFASIALWYLELLLLPSIQVAVLLPLLLLFAMAAVFAVMWYRFGQFLGGVFRHRPMSQAGLVVLVSVIPLLGLLLSMATLSELEILQPSLGLAALYTGLLLLLVLAMIFELVMVTIGILLAQPKSRRR